MINKMRYLKLKKEQVITIGLVFAVLLTTIILNIYLPQNKNKLKASVNSEKTAMFMQGSKINLKMKILAGNQDVADFPSLSSDEKITQIKRSTTISS